LKEKVNEDEYIEDVSDTEDEEEEDKDTSKKWKKHKLKPTFKYQKVKILKNTCYNRHISQNSYISHEYLILDNNNTIKLYNLAANK